MRVKLLTPHIIRGRYMQVGEFTDLGAPDEVTLQMVPLDQQSQAAMQVEYDRAYDLYKNVYYREWVPLYGVRGRVPSVPAPPLVEHFPPLREVGPQVVLPLPPAAPAIRRAPIGRVMLLDVHVIRDQVLGKGAVVELFDPLEASPLMQGLDESTRLAVTEARLRVWGRHPDIPYNLPSYSRPLDDPPIPRPLEENQPVGRAQLRNYRDYIS